MPTDVTEERKRWILPLINKEVKLKDVVRVCPHSERSLKRWTASYRTYGEKGLEPRSTRPKTNPRETSIRLKEKVIELRKQTKLCALKLHWKLEKRGIKIHERTIGKILKTENMVRKYRVKKITYKYIKVTLRPGELVEIDVKYVPGRVQGKRYFQYTAIDCASRWRHLQSYDEQTSDHSVRFLKEVIDTFPYTIKAVKTDNGSIFTNYYIGTNKRSDLLVKTLHGLDVFCQKNNITHFLIDPGKPAQNGKVERSHREDQEKFYDKHTFRSFKDLQKKMRIWNDYYNDLEHCGLNGKTPNEMLALIKGTNVCA